MSPWRLIWRSLLYYRRSNFAVAWGVAAATAVLTGALLVGDSVRGSLRTLALDRLGSIDQALVSDRFFRAEVADQLAASPVVRQYFAAVAGVILLPEVTIERQQAEPAARASRVLLVGSGESFWELGREVRPRVLPGRDEIVLNQALADDLRVTVGDEVLVRLPKADAVPAESPLAQTADRIRSVTGLKVVDIVPARGLGRFALHPSQAIPRAAFVALDTIQSPLDMSGRINGLLVGKRDDREVSETAASEQLNAALPLTLEDYGFRLDRIREQFGSGAESRTIYDYFRVSTDRMLFAPEAAEAARRAFGPLGGQAAYTYLANTIEKLSPKGETPAGRSVPYSTVTALDFSPEFPLPDSQGQPLPPLGPQEIVLNAWTARELAAEPGDQIRLAYYEPETTHGRAIERSATFTLRGITPLTEPSQPYGRRDPARYDQPPAPANDPHLTPEVQGVTDQESIDDWDPPFPFDYGRVLEADEAYWDNYRTTPKAFLGLEAGQGLWKSRFGDATTFRIPAREYTQQQLAERFLQELQPVQADLGLGFRPLRYQQLRAASGTTPFDLLFLGLSSFVIVAALLLVAILFRLGVEQRASSIGMLLATGLQRSQVRRFLLAEAGLVSLGGGLLGIAVGMGYAWLMLIGLQTWFVDAITTPFLEFHYTLRSLLIGCALGILASLATIAWSVRQLRRVSARRLLTGQTQAPLSAGTSGRRRRWWPLGLVGLAVVITILATRLGGMAQAGAFVGAGCLLLLGLLLLIWQSLKRAGGERGRGMTSRLVLLWLALRNAGRNPGRSAATIGLMATASFLILAMSSFRLAPTESGTGGFQLLAESSEPVFAELGDPEVRAEQFGKQAEALAHTQLFALRLRPGDDASCNNLYLPSQPRVLGVPAALIRSFDNPSGPHFSWAGSAAADGVEAANPWHLLGKPAVAEDAPVPVVIDKNTAMYSLQLYGGVGQEFSVVYGNHQRIPFRVVGLLENSVLQGHLLIGEADFEQRFPEITGYRYFLIRAPAGEADAVAGVLEEQLSDQGFDAVPAAAVLAQLLAVQNTYLSTFQSLGLLGLLLGTFGLAAVQLRNVLERRGELALLRAAGYRRARLAQLILWENVLLLAQGLAVGALAALLAVLPHKLLGEAAFAPQLLRDLLLMLAAVFVVGVLTSLLAARATLRVPLLPALRGE